MNWCFWEQCRLGWGTSGRAILIASVIAASGCARGHEPAADVDQDESGLAALMADDDLPVGMKSAPAPMTPLPPARFCDFGSGGEPSDDAGVAESDASIDKPVPGRPPIGPGVPVAPPMAVPAGSPAPLPVAGSGGGAAGAGSMPPSTVDPSCASTPVGFWQFEGCNSFSTDIFDSSPQGHNAFRSVDLVCEAAQQGTGAKFSGPEDIVYAPDQPDFALGAGVTIAAWVKPDAVDHTRTLFRKRDGADSAFALLINNKRYQFVVRLNTGRLASVVAPAKAGIWTHVAASYDGAYLRLYLNGSEVNRTAAPGVLSRGAGPLLMGNDGAGRRFEGMLDDVWFNTLAAPDQTILQLTCVRRDPLVTVSPLVSAAVPAGTRVDYQLSILNQEGANCAPQAFGVSVNQVEGDFTIDPSFRDSQPVAAGDTLTETFAVTSGADVEAGSYGIQFFVFGKQGGPIFGGPGVFVSEGVAPSVGRAVSVSPPSAPPPIPSTPTAPPMGEPMTPPPPVFNGFVQVTAQYVVAEPTGCHVSTARALMIRDVGVVDDTLRSTFVVAPRDPRAGAWSFGRLMERLSRTDAEAPDVTEAMFRSFLSPQTINGFTIPVRPPMGPVVLDPWPRTADGKLDLARAPVRLLAIANRLDLKDLARGKAGEGRVVYGVLSSDFTLEFTVIFEYLLPATNEAEYADWANAFHALQDLPFPSEEYNQALQDITDLFSGRGFTPDRPNGSALIDVRTNEIALSEDGQWQLREFHVGAESGFLDPALIALTPDRSFDGSETLARFINANEASILTETHDVPAIFEGAPFQGAAVFNNIDLWSAPGVDSEARHKFSLNTCNGCHGAETQTGFLHVSPRQVGERSALSQFLTGEDVFDPFTGQIRRLNELARRRALLESVVCADAAE